MKLINLATSLLLVAAIAVSCRSAQPPKQYTFDKTRTIPKPFDRVWSETTQWLAQEGMPIKSMDKNGGFIYAEYKPRPGTDTLFDCGVTEEFFSLIGDRDEAIEPPVGHLNILIEKTSEATTQVTATMFWKANKRITHDGGTDHSRIENEAWDCNSSGVVEKRLFNYLLR